MNSTEKKAVIEYIAKTTIDSLNESIARDRFKLAQYIELEEIAKAIAEQIEPDGQEETRFWLDNEDVEIEDGICVYAEGTACFSSYNYTPYTHRDDPSFNCDESKSFNIDRNICLYHKSNNEESIRDFTEKEVVEIERLMRFF